MLQVDRGKYAKFNPYMDAPQGIGYGVTISAPHMVLYVSCYMYMLVYYLSTTCTANVNSCISNSIYFISLVP